MLRLGYFFLFYNPAAPRIFTRLFTNSFCPGVCSRTFFVFLYIFLLLLLDFSLRSSLLSLSCSVLPCCQLNRHTPKAVISSLHLMGFFAMVIHLLFLVLIIKLNLLAVVLKRNSSHCRLSPLSALIAASSAQQIMLK